MLTNNTIDFNSPIRNIYGKAELFSGSALSATFLHTDALRSISIERVGEEKFLGFGICQKLKIKLMDKDRLINIDKNNAFDIYFNDIKNFPRFYVEEVGRDENTNELDITAYDSLYAATAHTVNEINLTSYSLLEFAEACADLLGIGLVVDVPDAFALEYAEGANFDGAETIREALNSIADTTQTIYYLDSNNNLVFKRLDKAGEPVLTIGKASYFTLKSKPNRTITALIDATELGDNITASGSTEDGDTFVIRNNPFWELREDRAALVDSAFGAVSGLTASPIECSWRGNFLLELGDKIALITKDDEMIFTYFVSDTLEYEGGMKQTTNWSLGDDEKNTSSNPSTLGAAMKQTYAKVDKVNKQIDLVVSEVEANSESISSLQLTTNSITASVSNMSGDMGELAKKVDATISSEELEIAVKNEVANGVERVTTTTGFTFNENGLTVSKTGSEMNTQITEDGMKVFRDSGEVLTADNTGVKAENLHATTYLIVGVNSRFENYENGSRTGCFWIGG